MKENTAIAWNFCFLAGTSSGLTLANWTVEQLLYICVYFFIRYEVARSGKPLRGDECRSLLVFSFLTSSPDVAHLSEPRIFLNCITATNAMSYGWPWFIERLWWGYERAKDKVISPLPNGDTQFISRLSNSPIFSYLILRSTTLCCHFTRFVHCLVECTMLEWDREKCKEEKSITSLLRVGGPLWCNSSWSLFKLKWPYLQSSITTMRKKRGGEGGLRVKESACTWDSWEIMSRACDWMTGLVQSSTFNSELEQSEQVIAISYLLP